MNGLYPSKRAVFAAAAGIPVAVAAGLIAPSLWVLGLAWSGLVLAAMLADVMLGADRKTRHRLRHSRHLGREPRRRRALHTQFCRPRPPPPRIELEGDDRFAIAPARRILAPGEPQARFD